MQWVLPGARVRAFCHSVADWIYRAAVIFDNFWLERVLGIRVLVNGPLPDDRNREIIVVSNHRSWFDILLLQGIIVKRGPMLKFLIKRELVWVPIVGWICIALEFPRLSRRRVQEARQQDYDAVATAAARLKQTPSALMNFAEGTRFSTAKHSAQVSAYRHLLNPRSGGLRIMLEKLPDADLLDVTLVYPDDNVSFWRCLSGEIRTVEVDLARFSAIDLADVNAWLDARWREKEKRIDNHHRTAAGV